LLSSINLLKLIIEILSMCKEYRQQLRLRLSLQCKSITRQQTLVRYALGLSSWSPRVVALFHIPLPSISASFT
jgi:hypothetical protein